MNRGVKLLILLVVVLAVIGGTFWLIDYFTPELKPLSTVSGDSVKKVDLSKMTGIRWTWEDQEYDFSYADGKFTCNLQPDYVPKADNMQRILVNLQDIRAEKIIDQPQELSVYGLDDPAIVVKVADVEMHFGDLANLNDTYYMSLGDGKVYMVESKYYVEFARTREEMVQLGEIPDMSSLTKIQLSNEAGGLAVEYLPQSGKTYSDYYAWFEVGGNDLINQEVPKGLEIYLRDMAWLKCLDADPQNLADYGLDTPAATCTAFWDGGSYTFHIGSQNDQGYYAKAEGENRVYLLDQDTAVIMLNLSTKELQCVDVLKMDWTTAASVDVTMDGSTYTFTAQDGSWMLDGKAVEAKQVLEALDVMPAQAGENLTVEGMTTELQLVIHRNTDTFNPVTLTFYRLDGTNCVMQLDDHAPMLVSRSDLVALKEAFNTLILG